MTALKRSQAQYVSGRCRTGNWRECEMGLRQRGSQTGWTSEDELKGWGPPKRSGQKLGRKTQYSNHSLFSVLAILDFSVGLSIHVGNPQNGQSTGIGASFTLRLTPSLTRSLRLLSPARARPTFRA